MMGRDWYYCKFIVKLKFCAQTLHQIYLCCYRVTRDVFYVTFHSESYTPFTPAKHVLLNWFSLNENYKQRTEKLDFPLDSSTC